ncbi:MAG TPA: ribosome recycling factor [Candidatus Paceibacterota bacterium]|nr:ribosome recycling factor [Candidatus Paceibacterota bacterium]
MAYNFSPFKQRVAEIGEWLVKEFSVVRTGKASPAILDNVMVESYGSRTPLKHVAAISIQDAKTLYIAPWDKSQLRGIETAIAAANLGVSTSPDSGGVRVIFPDLTAERRGLLGKVIREKLEEARVSLRKEREKVWNDIQAEEKAGKLSEDEKFRAKDDLQKAVDEGNNRLDGLAAKKEEEILG